MALMHFTHGQPPMQACTQCKLRAASGHRGRGCMAEHEQVEKEGVSSWLFLENRPITLCNPDFSMKPSAFFAPPGLSLDIKVFDFCNAGLAWFPFAIGME